MRHCLGSEMKRITWKWSNLTTRGFNYSMCKEVNFFWSSTWLLDICIITEQNDALSFFAEFFLWSEASAPAIGNGQIQWVVSSGTVWYITFMVSERINVSFRGHTSRIRLVNPTLMITQTRIFHVTKTKTTVKLHLWLRIAICISFD